MFKKFDEKENISSVQQLKSSVQKQIRAKLLESYPHLENCVDQILPKKENFRIIKCHDHLEILVNSAGDMLFFRHRDGKLKYFCNLKILNIFLLCRKLDANFEIVPQISRISSQTTSRQRCNKICIERR